MAEPTLMLTLTDYRNRCTFFLGWGSAYSSASTAQKAIVDDCIKDGHTRFLECGYNWTFLKPEASLNLNAAYSTGTVTIVAGVVTLSGGTFPSWAAAGEINVAGASYSVNTRDSGTQVTLDDLSAAASAGTVYSLTQSDYDCPDDFGTLETPLAYGTQDSQRGFIRHVGESEIRGLREGGWQSGIPLYVAVGISGVTTASEGQRNQFKFWPRPSTALHLKYNYHAYQDAMTGTTPYPLGGLAHSQTILESILAVAELKLLDAPGAHSESFAVRLAASIKRDKELGPSNMGRFIGANKEMVNPSPNAPYSVLV